MMKTTPLPADELLMNGFAAHVQAWANCAGAPEASRSLLTRLAKNLCMATLAGHVCLDLNDEHAPEDLQTIREKLMTSGVVGTPDSPESKPLILDEDNRLYLHRYYDYERRLARRVQAMQEKNLDADQPRLRTCLDTFFGHPDDSPRLDWPRIATALAMQRKLLVISGGPGTGKTTTIVNLLACLIADNPDCRIALTAPTGKAAARMQETLQARASHLPAAIQMRLPGSSFTIHRLLGVTQENRFRHHVDNPLPFDAVIVDEASMLDLALATQLFEAIPPHARVILLGDKDQLSAVEAGAVFSELSADPGLSDACVSRLMQTTGVPENRIAPPVPRKTSGLQDSVVWFTENFRFAKDSPIGRLARHVSHGETDASLALLAQRADDTLVWLENESKTLTDDMVRTMDEGYARYRQALGTYQHDPAPVFDAFDHFRILCAMRESARGTHAINRLMDQVFRQPSEAAGNSFWYAGRPVMMLRNDYVLNLFNGDIGIALWDHAGTDKRLMVYFRDNQNGFRCIAPSRLPEHDTAFAMTVHKAQGSEFDSVLLMMPDTPNRLCTRELLYTGMTRARKHACICAGEAVLRSAIASPTQRNSGLHKQILRKSA